MAGAGRGEGVVQALREHFREIGVPRVMIGAFLATLFVVALVKRMDVATLLSDSLLRIGRNGLLVLALLPAIQGGVGLNFGLPIGVICGLVGRVGGLYDWEGWSDVEANAAAFVVARLSLGILRSSVS